jgi:ribosomal protein L37AE/L43A
MVEMVQGASESMNTCPECQSTMYPHKSGRFTEWICLNCGRYESDSPAYRTLPSLFDDIVRNDPAKFRGRFIKQLSDDFLQGKKSDGDLTVPAGGCCQVDG